MITRGNSGVPNMLDWKNFEIIDPGIVGKNKNSKPLEFDIERIWSPDKQLTSSDGLDELRYLGFKYFNPQICQNFAILSNDKAYILHPFYNVGHIFIYGYGDLNVLGHYIADENLFIKYYNFTNSDHRRDIEFDVTRLNSNPPLQLEENLTANRSYLSKFFSIVSGNRDLVDTDIKMLISRGR